MRSTCSRMPEPHGLLVRTLAGALLLASPAGGKSGVPTRNDPEIRTLTRTRAES